MKESKLVTELYSKKNNLLFFNVLFHDDEDTEHVLSSFLTDELDMDNGESTLIMNVHRLSFRSKEIKNPHPNIAEFVSMCEWNNILNKATTKSSIPGLHVDKKYDVSPPPLSPLRC